MWERPELALSLSNGLRDAPRTGKFLTADCADFTDGIRGRRRPQRECVSQLLTLSTLNFRRLILSAIREIRVIRGSSLGFRPWNFPPFLPRREGAHATYSQALARGKSQDFFVEKKNENKFGHVSTFSGKTSTIASNDVSTPKSTPGWDTA